MANKDEDRNKEVNLRRDESHHPLDLLDELERTFYEWGPSRLFDRSMRRGWPLGRALEPFRVRMPAVDVIDREDEVLVRAEVPGVAQDDLEVTVTENSVTISGHSKKEEEEQEDSFYRRETSYGKFSRTVGLPADVDADKGKAKFKDGLLEVTLPKVKATKRRGIKIESE